MVRKKFSPKVVGHTLSSDVKANLDFVQTYFDQAVAIEQEKGSDENKWAGYTGYMTFPVTPYVVIAAFNAGRAIGCVAVDRDSIDGFLRTFNNAASLVQEFAAADSAVVEEASVDE